MMPDEPKAETPATGWAALWEQVRKTPPVHIAWIVMAVLFGGLLREGVSEFRESRVSLVRLQQNTQEQIADRDAVTRAEAAKERAMFEAMITRITASIDRQTAEMVRLELLLDRMTRKLPGDGEDRP